MKRYFDWSGFRSHGNHDDKTYLDNFVCQFLSDAIMQQSQDQACPYDRFCLGMCDWTGCVETKVKPQSQLHPPATSKSEPHLPSCECFEFTDEETLKRTKLYIQTQNIIMIQLSAEHTAIRPVTLFMLLLSVLLY